MKFKSSAVYAGEEVPAKPRDQNCQRTKTARDEREKESTPVMEAILQQTAIAAAKSLKAPLKSFLKPYQRIAAGGRITPFFFISAQKILRHGRDDRPGEQIRCQHSENHCLGERHKEIPRYSGQQEHGSK